VFNANITGDDDDIFDDTKSLSSEEQRESFQFNSKKSSKKEFNMAMDSILEVLNNLIKNRDASPEDAKKLIDHLKVEHGVDLNNFMAMFRIKLAVTILDGSGSFVDDYETSDVPRSVVYALDSLSENRFTLVSRFFDIELENAKRIVISKFLQDVFLGNVSVNMMAFQELFDNGIDSRYVTTYYQSLYDINMFTIWQNNGVYAALGKELDLPCNQKILNVEEIMISDLSAEKYSNEKFNSLLGLELKKDIGDSVAEYTKRYLEYVKK